MRIHRLGRTLLAVSVAAIGMAACSPGKSEPAPAGSDTAGPSSATTPTPAGPAVPTKLDGTSYFALASAGSVQVFSVSNGTATKQAKIPVPANDYCPSNTVMVSPDGQWVAWATTNGHESGVYGTLSIARLDGSNPRTLDNVVCSLNELSWTPDSRKLAVNQTTGGTGRDLYIDPATGATEPAAPRDSVWSANRKFQVRKDPNVRTTFTVQDANGQVVKTVKDYSNDYGGFNMCGYTLKGVSDDGRYVTIGGCGTDPSRVLGARFLYDTAEGRHVNLPVKTATGIIFEPGNTVVLHGTSGEAAPSLSLMTPAGKVIQTVPDPQAVAHAQFLGYKLAGAQ